MITKAKQLASITAAGVGAIALTSGKADASSIISSALLNQTLGFTSDAFPTGRNVVVSTLIFNTFNSGPILRFQALSNKSSTGSYDREIAMGRGGARNTSFGIRFGGGIPTFSFGATWAAASEHGANLSLESRRFGSGAGMARPTYTNQFYLFRFNGGSFAEYGWIEASMSLTNSRSADAADGPTLTIFQYAFDTSGAKISAGDLGSPSPEPSSIAESGLGALILGAEGLRRWRRSRKSD